MLQIYNSLVCSIITFSMIAWYGNCGVKEKSKIQSIIKVARKIVNNDLTTIEHLYLQAVERKAVKIINNPKHPLNDNFKILPSGRRYAQIKCRTNRFKSTFIPSAIKVINNIPQI